MRLLNDGAEGITKRYEYDGSGNVIYVGVAESGTATSAAGWSVQRFTYTGSNVTASEWAGGGSNRRFAWDDRATLSYS